MTLALSAVAFLVLFTLLVLIHELGHFAVARICGVHVEEFGFGLPPRARGLFTWRGTLFSLNWIPFGGFVRLQGETSLDPLERERTGSFAKASIASRLAILLAGVLMNFLLALVLLTAGFSLWRWVPTYLSLDDLRDAARSGEVAVEWGLYVARVLPGSTAEHAGVSSGTLLKAVNGRRVETAEDVLALQAGEMSVRYTLGSGPDFDVEQILEVGVRDGKTGVALSATALHMEGVAHSLPAALRLALRETWVVVTQTVRGAGQLILSLVSEWRVPRGITGIVGIAQLTHDSVREGLMTYLRLVALLSLSLAALNVLPFPALDGGRVLFVLFEGVTRRPLERRLEVGTHAVGFLVLLLLIAAVTLNDILRLFSAAPPPAPL